MAGKLRTYTMEFGMEAVQLWERSGKSARQIERELGITQGMLGQWQRRYVTSRPLMSARAEQGVSSAPGTARMSEMEAEIRRLKREVARLSEARDILKKWSGCFVGNSRDALRVGQALEW